MCHSQAEGGQRCHGHAAAALTAAERKLTTLAAVAAVYDGRGQPLPPDVRAQGMQAEYDLDDARARYASTPQGATDINNRMALIVDTTDLNFDGPARAAAGTYNDYAKALSEGTRLRSKAANIRASRKAGTLTSEQAVALAQYPTSATVQYRRDRIGTPTTRLTTGSRTQAAYEKHMNAIWAGTANGFSEHALRTQLAEHTEVLADLNAGRITPRSVIGSGVRREMSTARTWLTDQINNCNEAIATRGRSDSVNQFNTASALHDLDAR